MRILMVSQNYPPRVSGYAVWCADVERLMRERGHVVRVLTCAGEPADGREAADVRRVLRNRAKADLSDPGLRRAPQYLGCLMTYRGNGAAVAAEAREFGADVAAVWQFNGLGPDVVQALQRLGIPTVLCVGDQFLRFLHARLAKHRGVIWRFARAVLYRRLVRDLPKTPLVVCSEALKDYYVREGFDERRMTVIPLAVERRWAAARPPEGGPGNRLLYVGRLHPAKGVDVAIRALAVLNASCVRSGQASGPGRFTLDISGTGAPEYVETLKDLARDLGLESAVRFLEPTDRERLRARYDAHDVVLIPSVWFEGGPTTLVEAMARGIPAVASDRGGPTSIITHGADGLLVTPESPEALADGVRALARDPAQRRTIGERAIAKVREKFVLEDAAPKWEDVLRRVAEGKD